MGRTSSRTGRLCMCGQHPSYSFSLPSLCNVSVHLCPLTHRADVSILKNSNVQKVCRTTGLNCLYPIYPECVNLNIYRQILKFKLLIFRLFNYAVLTTEFMYCRVRRQRDLE
jgi:hypothetical protein